MNCGHTGYAGCAQCEMESLETRLAEAEKERDLKSRAFVVIAKKADRFETRLADVEKREQHLRNGLQKMVDAHEWPADIDKLIFNYVEDVLSGLE